MKRYSSFTDFEAFFGLSLGFKAVFWEVWRPSSNFPFRSPLVCKSVVFSLYDDCGSCGQCEVSEQCWDQVSMWDQSHCDASLTLEYWVMPYIADFFLFLEPKVCFGEIYQVILLLSLASKPFGQHMPRLVWAPQKPLPWFYLQQCVQSPFPVTKQSSSVFQMV